MTVSLNESEYRQNDASNDVHPFRPLRAHPRFLVIYFTFERKNAFIKLYLQLHCVHEVKHESASKRFVLAIFIGSRDERTSAIF